MYSLIHKVYAASGGESDPQRLTTVVSFRADDALVAALDQLASATHRDRPYHLRQALAQYLERQAWHVSAIDEGSADANAGNLLEHQVIERKWGLA
ncbi:MAG: hypothetical protein GAK45_02401 [Pseudomonas citronellolis]|nr:MAG: hypothetical protein GAK45_02401 [Pseudomonas citronellolis]